MNNIIFFEDLFESMPDYIKIVLLKYIFQNDRTLLCEIGFSERNINRLNLERKKLIIEKHEEYLSYVRNEEETVIEKILNK